ncbi:hypothetical protein HY637_01825 [Candidatus Woesearchaeota archaeon]|nr:hypothetical protein [Candidatus Woesearchaeota archaeon]
MTHASPKCPHCGRSLTPDEIYCYFCEMNIYQLRKKHKKIKEQLFKRKNKAKGKNKKSAFSNFFEKIRNFFVVDKR